MPDTLSEDDVEKTVETTTGDEIGVVTDVEGQTARIEPSAGVMNSIRSALGWGADDQETVRIHEDDVVDVSNSVVQIERESPPDESPEAGIMTGTVSPQERDTDETNRNSEASPSTERDETGRDDETRRNDEPGERSSGTERVGSDPGPETGSGASTGAGGVAEDVDTGRSRERSETPEADIVEELNRGEPVDPTRGVDERDESDPSEASGGRSAADYESGPTNEGVEPLETSPDDAPDTGDRDPMDDAGDRDLTESDAGADEVDPSGEVDRGVEIESVDELGSDDGADGSIEESRETDPDVGDEFDVGTDADRLEAAADVDEMVDGPDDVDGPGGAGGTDRELASSDRTTSRTDPADELDPGIDADSLAQAATDSGSGDESGGRAADRDPGTPSDVNIGPETIAGSRTGGAEGAAGSSGTHPVEEVPVGGDAGTNLDDASGTRGVALDVERLPAAREESPVEGAIDAQRTAITGGQRLLARGLETQQTLLLGTLATQATFQRRSLDAMRRWTTATFEALSATTGAGAGDSNDSGLSDGTQEVSVDRIRELEATLDRQSKMLAEIQETLDAERDAQNDSAKGSYTGSR